LSARSKAELAGAEKEMRGERRVRPLHLDTFENELNFIVRAGTTEKVGAHTELVMAESQIDTGSETSPKAHPPLEGDASCAFGPPTSLRNFNRRLLIPST